MIKNLHYFHLISMVLSLILMLLSFISCIKSNDTIQHEIENFMNSKIMIPFDSLQMYINGQLSTKSLHKNSYKLVIYVDSTECSPCVLNSSSRWSPIISSSKEIDKNIEYIFIFSPKEHEQAEFKQNVSLFTSDFPIFLDDSGCFMRCNPNIPKSILLHTFLIDNNGNVVLVGNPLTNWRIRELFFEILKDKSSYSNVVNAD